MDDAAHEDSGLRAVRPPESPFPGTLHAGSVPTIRVAADVFGASPAWRCDGAEHVLAPTDALREEGGVRVVLPHCPLRLRDAVAGAVPAGALVTVAVSLLRGAREADALDAIAGSWWVTADGRPVVALTGDDDWREEARLILDELAETAAPDAAGPLAAASDALTDRRRTAQGAEAAEAALFGIAIAEPITVQPPRVEAGGGPADRAAATRSGAARPAATRASEAARDPRPGPASAILEGIGRLVDRGIADRIRDAVVPLARATRRRPRGSTADPASPAPRRRGPWLLAACLAGAVVVAGVAWPSAAEPPQPEPAASDPPGPTPGAAAQDPSETDTVTDPAGPETAAPDSRDPVAAAVRLIAEFGACPDDACVAGRWEDQTRARRPQSGPAASVTLVDEYGGVAVVRVEEAAVAEIVVLVSTDAKWLVREIYDLADQP